MDFIFADDARQKTPSRKGLGALVAIGGIHVPHEKVGPLEKKIKQLCEEIGFPPGEQFKWSPGKRDTFMRNSLIGEARLEFYRRLCQLGVECGATIDTKPPLVYTPSYQKQNTHLFSLKSTFL